MEKNKKILILVAAYTLLLLVMFILPFYSTHDYSIISNTLSQLGAQKTQNAWIMNFTFVFLGIGSIVAGWKYFEGFAFQRIFLLLFGISLGLAAFFNHAPANTYVQYDTREDGWHSYFFFTTTLTFVLLTFASAFIIEKHRDRILSAVVGVSVIFISYLMSVVAQAAGIWQRLFFIISFAWMIYIFKSREF